MTKIRSEEDLQDRIDEEMSWRRIQLVDIKKLLIDHNKKRNEDALKNSLVTMSYSHWEGFVKAISIHYLTYIKFKGYTQNRISVALRSSLTYWLISQNNSQSSSDKILQLKEFLSNSTYKLNIPLNIMIDTKSNLNSEVLKNIIINIGLDTSTFATSYIFIDSVLLNYRNKIAHGERTDLTYDDALDICDKSLELMERYKTLIENAVVLKSYQL